MIGIFVVADVIKYLFGDAYKSVRMLVVVISELLGIVKECCFITINYLTLFILFKFDFIFFFVGALNLTRLNVTKFEVLHAYIVKRTLI